jgi:hypothetical protein
VVVAPEEARSLFTGLSEDTPWCLLDRLDNWAAFVDRVAHHKPVDSDDRRHAEMSREECNPDIARLPEEWRTAATSGLRPWDELYAALTSVGSPRGET